MRRREILKCTGLLAVSPQLSWGVEAQSSEPTWPMFQFDAANTGYNPDASIATEQVGQQWRTSTLGEVVASPVIANGMAFVGSRDGKVYAMALEDGSKQWEYNISEPIESTPVAADGSIYVGDANGKIHALSWDGSKQWTVDATSEDDSSFGVYTALTYYEGKIFAVLDDTEYTGTYLVAIDSEGGSIAWTHPESDTAAGSGDSPPIVSEGTVYVTMEGVRSIDIFDGDINWSIDNLNIGDGVAGVGGPLSLDGTDLIAASGGLVCLDKSDGSLKWRNSNTDVRRVGSAVINGRDIFVTAITDSDDGFIYSFDRVTGEQQWEKQLREPTYSDTVATENMVFTGDESGKIYAFQRSNGSRLWTFSTDDSVRSTPALVGDSLYVGSNDGYVYSLGKVDDTSQAPTKENTETSTATSESQTTPTETTPTQTTTQTPPRTSTDGTTTTPTATGEDFQRGFFTNGGESSFAFLNNPLVLTVVGFFLSVFGIVYQLVEGD